MLTLDIVKKQNDSLESIKLLSRKTDTIISDISNMINSIQMIGNGQFTENRVQDDSDSTNNNNNNIRHPRDAVASDPQAPVSSELLNLRSLLLEAFEVIPDNKVDTPPNEKDTDYTEEVIEEAREVEEQQENSRTQSGLQLNPSNPGLCLIDYLRDNKLTTSQENHPQAPLETTNENRPDNLEQESNQHDSAPAEPEKKSKNNNLIDKHRISDILKRYSLYDEDEDEEDDESYDEDVN